MSRYSQSLEHGVSGDLNRTTTGQYPHLPPRDEFVMQAHDTNRGRQGAMPNSMYQTIDRGSARVPELENGRTKSENDRGSGHRLARFLRKDRSKQHTREKLVISSPISVSPGHAPHRPVRPPIEQTPASFYGISTLQNSEAPMPPPKHMPANPKPTIRKENLGTAKEALGSHPAATSLETMRREYPAERILTRSATKDRNRRTAVFRSSDSDGIVLLKPEISQERKLERRKGRVFQSGPMLTAIQEFQEFPNPETFDGQDDDQFWDDAGINDDSEVVVPEPEDGDPEMTIIPRRQKLDGNVVPELSITAPERDDDTKKVTMTRSGRPSKPLLDVDDAYERLYHRQEKEVRRLKYLAPLAWMVADAEGIEPTDIDALASALQNIINDNTKLWNLWPLAVTLAEDQNLDLDEYQTFPQALQKVLDDRDSAKRAAYHHMTRQRQLEGRVRQMQRERQQHMERETYQYQDEEDYIR
ncbi:hypothetical protein F4779DRAFT_634828 [Xylariaceae sp. FL0662B]|nr:hypothetical protein F4779DRAFT_634828 [Xylariaceae sp. FL0662B]